jgi:CheY-like chemotaxis protein
LRNVRTTFVAAVIGLSDPLFLPEIADRLDKVDISFLWPEAFHSDTETPSYERSFMSRFKLLVVDDSQSIRFTVRRILANAGYDVITAADGLEAMDRLKEDPALVVLDVNMPGLDGFGVCEKMRESGSGYEQTPVVFLTSMEAKALELLGQEFGAYLHKPVREAQLLSAIEQQLALVTD